MQSVQVDSIYTTLHTDWSDRRKILKLLLIFVAHVFTLMTPYFNSNHTEILVETEMNLHRHILFDKMHVLIGQTS